MAVAIAAIGGTSFRGADLTDADFVGAQLKSINLRQATITRTNWHKTVKLDHARTGETILHNPAVRELMVTHRGVGKSYTGYDFKGANLVGADLSDADLTEADISQATLEGAWLERAKLTKTQALGTNFHQAHLTGACLEGWNINSTTILEDVICEHVYLLRDHKERRPNSGVFGTGEFTKLFEEVLDTIDLIFRNGLDWKAFIAAFGKVRVENDDTELDIQSIENKGDGVMVVKLRASPDADKYKIHQSMMTKYDIALKAIEEKYRTQLDAKDGQISQYQQENTNLLEIIKLVAKRPINVETNVEAKAVADNKNYDLSQAKFGGGFAAYGGMQIGGTFNDLSQTQDLAEAANKIQQLLTQFQGQGSSADAAQEEAAKALAAQAQQEPGLMAKLVNWGKALGGDASKAATNEAAKVAGGEAAKIVITKALTLLGLSLL